MNTRIRFNRLSFGLAACTAALAAAPLPAHGAPPIGPAVDVAPRVERTRLQKWPRAAWASESKCYLVVWREGDITEHDTDIWCARVGADGSAKDPAGIRVTGAARTQDRPVVASDGKDFLVLWQDFRSDTDWDVYAARVSGDGRVMDPDGFLVAGGPHNQCMPCTAWAGGRYHTAWQSFVDKVLPPKNMFGTYEICGTRVSSEGTVLDAGGIKLVKVTAILPTMAVSEKGDLALGWVGRERDGQATGGQHANFPGLLMLDPAKGVPLGTPVYITRERRRWGRARVPGLALARDGGGLYSNVSIKAHTLGVRAFSFDSQTQMAGEFLVLSKVDREPELIPFSSVAESGGRFLVTVDALTYEGRKGSGHYYVNVRGFIVSESGEILDGGKDGFAIAAEKKKNRVQGFACAGPDGSFLVTYADMRGVENTRIVAKVIGSTDVQEARKEEK